ncbi:hypothetical protein GCM10007916_29570 [Psychromonas marina]|uniref:Uncharacterized protein n=1 Tax=Psychromonas marina TaxID=88364 RepID=A0ABQ6E3G6_9GAMM|nr:hypothetical protein [Psychromonas marina]GLS91887.1 hypothetical protein GCM10007916_29570 [Psychromonas marina]
MSLCHNPIQKLSLAALLFFSSAALAHYPLMQCEYAEQKIECEAGYSDGSKAIDYQVSMFDYDDNLIAKVKTDIRSIATFEKSVDEFYIVFDSGHEYPVEVDSVEIQ